MKKTILVFGLIAGSIVSAVMATSIALWHDSASYMNYGMVIGYTSMIVAFSFVFVGVKNYRDKYSGGLITFGKALQVGLLISLIASTMYVITWVVDYYVFIPDFMEKYSEMVISKARAEGASDAEIASQIKEMAPYKEMYKNPAFVVLLTYMEILPVALIMSLIAAFSLKRKESQTRQAFA